MDDIKIVDAHHHFWDPIKNYHPWLCDEPMIPFAVAVVGLSWTTSTDNGEGGEWFAQSWGGR